MALRDRIRTQIGVPRIPAASRVENQVAVFTIVSEGQKEEPQYLRYVFSMCRRRFETSMQIHIINDELSALGMPEHDSNPLSRLRSLKIWLSRYNPDFESHYDDTAWLICDRDDGSFSVKQLRTVVNECEAFRIHFVLSNPAFQLWLLFHFTDNIRLQELNKAKFSKGKLMKVEEMLQEYVPDYKHGEIEMTNFDYLLDSASNNSQLYPTSVQALKRHVGTNFSELMVFIKHAFGIKSFSQIL